MPSGPETAYSPFARPLSRRIQIDEMRVNQDLGFVDLGRLLSHLPRSNCRIKKCGVIDLTFFRQGNHLRRTHAHFPNVTIQNVPGVVN